MIPQRNPRIAIQNVWATYLLVGLNTFMYFLSQSVDELQAGAAIPLLIWKGEIWRLFSAIFIHGNFFHYAFNTFVLLQIGRLCEPILGGFRLLFIFLISGAAGFALSVITNSSLAIGSSGAVFGVIGAMLGAMLNLPKAKVDLRLLRSLIIFIAFNFLFAAFANTVLLEGIRIDNASHIGGLFFGLLFGFVFVTETPFFLACSEEFRKTRKNLTSVALGTGLLALLALISIAIRPVFLNDFHERMAFDAVLHKKYDLARSHASYLEKSDENWKAQVIYARLLAQEGKEEQAIELVRLGMKKWSAFNRSFIASMLADNLFGDPKGNRVFCKAIIQNVVDEDSALLNDCAWLLLTTSQESVKDPRLALEWILQATKLKSDLPAAFYHTLGEAYLQNGKKVEALHAIERGLVKSDATANRELLRLQRRAEELVN